MTTQETRYDLVFFGTDLQGMERAEAFVKLAQWMKVGPEQLVTLLQENGRVLVPGLAAAAGAEAQRQVVAMGIHCNLRPCSASGLTPDLAPVEKPVATLACPACGHVHQAGATAPEVCQQCGVIFAKYEKAAQEKQEREQIRQSLLTEYQRRLEQEERDADERSAQERRRELEDEIRKQLGLPKMVTNRTDLINSAAGVFLLGLLFGVGGFWGYGLLFGSGPVAAVAPDPSQSVGGALAVGQAAAESGVFDPGMVAQMQVSGLLAAGAPAVPNPNPAASGAVPAAGAGVPKAAAVGAVVLSTGEFLGSRLADLKNDPEWDLYVLDRIDALHERGDTPQAVALADYLRNPELRFDRGAWLADELWHAGLTADAENLYRRLSAAAERQPDTAGARVAAFSTLARHLYRAGRPADAERLQHKAKTITDAVTAPADKAAAESELAALLTDLGRPQDARAHYKAAMQALGRIQAPAERLSAIPALARGYAKAGFRASALSLLERATDASAAITDASERDRLLGVLAATNAQLGDMQAAMATAARISSPALKDRATYQIIATEIASDRLATAITLAERLRTPAYQALAAGLLGLRQQQEPAYRPLAARSAERAALAIAAMTDPAQKSVVLAELARFAARSGDAAAADRQFLDALQFAEAVPSVPERDRTLIILATNEALALRFADARKRLPRVTDPQLRLALTSELNGLYEAVKLAGP